MTFNRLQIGLSFLCLLAFGASVGFVLAGISTYLPYFLVVLLVALVPTCIPGFESAVREFIGRNRNVTQPVEHVEQNSHHAQPVYAQASPEHAENNQPQSSGWLREAYASFWMNVKAFFQSVADGTREFADRNGPQARQLLTDASDSVRNSASASSNKVGESVKSSPYLWVAIILAIISVSLFAHSFVYQSYGLDFHFGMYTGVVSAISCCLHVDKDHFLLWLKNNMSFVWLIASVVSLIAAYYHKDTGMMFISGVSTVLALYIVVNGWDKTKEGVQKSMKTILGFLMKLLSGGFGYGKMFMSWAVILFLMMAPKLMSGQPMSKEEQDFFSTVAVGFVLCLIAGVLIGFHSIGQPEKKDTKKKKK